jgi:L-amino acid N-acyltransferase YncA
VSPASRGPPASHSALVLRDAQEGDMPAIAPIYAHHVLHGLATFEEIPPSIDELLVRRTRILEAGLPYLAAHLDGRVIGYAYASRYHTRAAYRYTVEDSVYLANGFGGRGIGTRLLQALVARCEAGPWRQMLAIIGNSGNAASIALHRRVGFQQIGTLHCVGFKLGQWVDTVLMQRPLGAASSTPPAPEGS